MEIEASNNTISNLEEGNHANEMKKAKSAFASLCSVFAFTALHYEYDAIRNSTYIKLKELIGSTNIANHTFISRKNKLCEIRSAIRSFDEEVNGVLNFVLQLENDDAVMECIHQHALQELKRYSLFVNVQSHLVTHFPNINGGFLEETDDLGAIMDLLIQLVFENHQELRDIVYKENQPASSLDTIIFKFLSSPEHHWLELKSLVFCDDDEDEYTVSFSEFFLKSNCNVPAMDAFFVPLLSSFRDFVQKYEGTEERLDALALITKQLLKTFVQEFSVDRWKKYLNKFLDNLICSDSFDNNPPVLRLLFNDVNPGYLQKDRCDHCFRMYEEPDSGGYFPEVYLNRVYPSGLFFHPPVISADGTTTLYAMHEELNAV